MTPKEANQMLVALHTMSSCSLSGNIYVPYESVKLLIQAFIDEVSDVRSE
jgi:hypothetical protein